MINPDWQALPGGPFATIVADPPWQYNDRINPETRGAVNHYATMSADDIATLPVETAAEDRAHLYLWTTNAFMAEAHELAKAWGFVPKTIITWVKIKQGGERFGDVRIGMGHYWRNATEHVLFCVRGKPALKTLRRNQPTVFFAERSQHSAKPQEFYDLVEGMSPGPRLELFARTPRDGWAVWGDEVRD